MPEPTPTRPPDAPTEYECLRCGRRVRNETHPGTCPVCDSRLQNLGVTRQL